MKANIFINKLRCSSNMSEIKEGYEKYFFKTGPERPPWSPPPREGSESGKIDPADHLLYLDNTKAENAMYIQCVWVGPGSESDQTIAEPHTHSFPELIGFFGYNPENTRDLGGEIKIWSDGEKKYYN